MIVLGAIEKLGGLDAFLFSVVVAGLLQLALGFLRAGVIGAYFPSAVIKGMLAAIGVDRSHRPHTLRREFGDLGVVLFVFGGDEIAHRLIALQRRAGGGALELRAIGGSGVEYIALVADADLHLLFGDLEIAVSKGSACESVGLPTGAEVTVRWRDAAG